jgi:hypothetical protein
MQLVMFVWNFTSSISNDFTGWRFAGDFLYLLMILCVFYFLRGLVGSLNKNTLFTEVNIRRLHYIGYCYLGYSLLRMILDLILMFQHQHFTGKSDVTGIIINGTAYIFRGISGMVLYGLVFLVIAAVLGHPSVLKRGREPEIEPDPSGDH